MHAACLALETRYAHLTGRVHVAPHIGQWRVLVSAAAAQLPPPPPTYNMAIPLKPRGDAHAPRPAGAADGASDAPTHGSLRKGGGGTAVASADGGSVETADRSGLPVRTVVAVLALPPGGGKSSLFAALRAEGASVASSDEERARGGQFDQTLGRLLRTEPLVCYDKNVPNLEGFVKLLKVLTAIERQQRVQVRVLLVVPASIRHDVAWARVEGRPADDNALNVHTCNGGRAEAYRIFKTIFHDACVGFVPLAR